MSTKIAPRTVRGLAVLLALSLLAALAGCAADAQDQMAKLEVGMDKSQVQDTVGKPEAIKRVRFATYSRDYLVWEYDWVPVGPPCITEGAGRMLTGVVTLGLSEVGWTNAKAKPHWVYFLDGKLVYVSRAVDCRTGECRAWVDISDPNYAKKQ